MFNSIDLNDGFGAVRSLLCFVAVVHDYPYPFSFFLIFSYSTVINENGEYKPLHSQVETKIGEFLSMWLKIP